MRILIRQAAVVTLDEARPVLGPADIAVDRGTIVAVGAAPAAFEPDEVIDARFHLAAPAFFNAHTHTSAVLARGARRSGSAPARPIPEPQDGEQAYFAAQLALAEMIRGGVAGFADHAFYMPRVAEAVAGSGMRAALAWCTYGGDGGEVGGGVADVAAFAEEWNGAAEGRIRTALGPYSAGVCSPMFLARSAAVAARLGVGVHLHVAETAAEVASVRAAYDMTPVELLGKNGVFDVSVTAVHAIHLTHVDVDVLAERGACVAYCPVAQEVAGEGHTPVALLRAAGVRVGIGTDGADRAFGLDMWQAVRAGAAACLPAPDDTPEGRMAAFGTAFRLATREGAEVLGFPRSGRIAPGYNADLLLIDCRRAPLWPVVDPLTTLYHGVQAAHVTDLLVAGRWLLRRGELTTIDEARAISALSAGG